MGLRRQKYMKKLISFKEDFLFQFPKNGKKDIFVGKKHITIE